VRPADRDAAIALLAAQLAEHEIALPPARLATAVDGVLDDASRGELLLGVVDGHPVGVAYLSYTWTLEHGGRVGWLEELYVHPASRERGVGTALLEAVCTRAAAAGCIAVELEVEASHARAARLYERRGFRRLARTRFSRPLR